VANPSEATAEREVKPIPQALRKSFGDFLERHGSKPTAWLAWGIERRSMSRAASDNEPVANPSEATAEREVKPIPQALRKSFGDFLMP